MNVRPSPSRLAEPAWNERAQEHETRVRAWTDPHQERTARGIRHPIEDFLFTYYSFRPAWLRRWHPGPGTVLEGPGAQTFLQWPEYAETTGGVALDPTRADAGRRRFTAWLAALLDACAARPALFGCFGLHEWAMVYRLQPDEIRHAQLPLRLPPDQIAAIVEAGPVCCTHFDAFRFFTPPARPLNRLQPTRESVPLLEQRGCLHANMDLYKWAYKLTPFCPSELTADAFALAREIRELDMRASPYDLAAYGLEPVRIETAEGRADYERLQRGFSTRADTLRSRLRKVCADLLSAWEEEPIRASSQAPDHPQA
jgi:hypothetical protein